jgi:5-methyltetrahydrofolate--homocysteine methyltransferase
MEQTLNQLKEAIVQASGSRVDQLLGEVKGKADFDMIFSNCIGPALDTLCSSIKQRQCAIPELLMGLKQVHRITQSVGGGAETSKRNQTIVIGVVEGDIHDMGKNIIRDVCKGYGYEVIDLGKNVSSRAFIEAAEDRGADMACLSTMLSTTIDSVKKTVKDLKTSRPGIRVLIGGAFMNDLIASEVGADGYAENAATVMPVIERVFQ